MSRLGHTGVVNLVSCSQLCHLAQRLFNASSLRMCIVSEQAGVVELAEKIAGVELASSKGLVGRLGELPVVEARS